jgi:kumamolisin
MKRPKASYVQVVGSTRLAPPGATLVGSIEPEAILALTLHFRRRSPAPPTGGAEDLARLKGHVSREELARQRVRTHKRAVARIADFLRRRDVLVRTIDYARRRMEIEAPASVLIALFNAEVKLYAEGGRTFRARTGTLCLPRHIAPWVRAIVGFDQRPLRPLYTRPAVASGNGSAAMWPSKVAALYSVPLDVDVSRQCVGLIALGGGYLPENLAQAMAGQGRQSPEIVEVFVGGTANHFGDNDRADEEIALDVQVLAALLPGARIVIYYAENSQQALADALDAAVYDSINNPKVISVSWGAPELHWTSPRREALNATLCDAARLRISVVVATGDDLATCNEPDGHAHVWFPASSPYVLSCGGTSVDFFDDTLVDESVWNVGSAGTGGGVSDFFPVASFQATAGVPLSVSTGGAGRGVPDVAAMAAETPGYRIIVNGEDRSLGGTSAATPLWAGILTIANSLRSTPLGLVAPTLYLSPGATRAIRQGNNMKNGVGYSASAGWSACTGLGVPIGTRLLDVLTEMTTA